MKSLFAGLAVVAALVGAPAKAATFNFVSDCADCSVDHGPGTQATASLTVDDSIWNRFTTSPSESTNFFAEGYATSFTYHSDWLGTLEAPLAGTSFTFIASDPSDPFSSLSFFVIRFSAPTDDELKEFVFRGQTGLSGNRSWTVTYGTPLVEDYGTLQPGAWTVAAVPEPETYAMLLAGLGVLGAAAKRRKSKAA